MDNVHHLGHVLLSVLVLPAASRPPAYLDPGSGSFLLQLLLAGILGGLFAVRAFWGRLKNKISRKDESDQDEPDSE